MKKNDKLSVLWTLFSMFFKIGAVTFGGGLAMLPILRRELVENRKWVTDDEMIEYFVIGQSTPGIIATNVSTFVGYKKAGLLGATVAGIGIVLPSIIVITLIAAFTTSFSEIEILQKAMRGINVAVAMLLFNAVLDLSKKTVKDACTFLIGVLAFVAMLVFKVSAFWIVISAGVLGFLIQTVKQARSKS